MKLGLFGRPVGHSKSPKIFQRLGRLLGKKISYEAKEVGRGMLPAAVDWAKISGWSGANVTIPYKGEAHDLADVSTAEAGVTRAANVLKFGKTVTGHNTDADGFADAVKRAGINLKGKKVLIFGAGGAARAVGYACAKLRAADVRFCARRPKEAKRSAYLVHRLWDRPGPDFSSGAPRTADVWVNATPLGMKGFPDKSPAPKKLAAPAYAIDLVYGRKTAFQKDARRRGAQTQDGTAMLVFQALRAYEFWGGKIGARRGAIAEKLIKELS